jgi:hypothetical protein
VTFVHEEAGTSIFVEGDESLVTSNTEIEHMTEDMLAEIKWFRNTAQVSHSNQQIPVMDYPKQTVRLQPTPSSASNNLSAGSGVKRKMLNGAHANGGHPYFEGPVF